MLQPGYAFCTGCGKPKPIEATQTSAKFPGTYTSLDPRYLVVQCGRVKRPGTLDQSFARQVIKDRRRRIKARKAEKLRFETVSTLP